MSEYIEELTYTDDKPDIVALSQHYATTTADLGFYFDQCRRNYDDRRNLWAGKSWDLRKNAVDAFPWQGASDQETHVVGERIDTHVALAMNALNRSHIKALAANVESLPRAATVSAFAKWMRSNYIRNFQTEHEKACNYGYEKGLMITYVGWESVERTYQQRFTLEEIAAANPDVADMIETGEDDEMLADMLIQAFPKLKPARAKKAIRQLRATGEATLVVSRKGPMDSRPYVKACAPDGEVFFPAYCMDPQRAPYVFWRQLYTVQEIENKVTNEGWSREWADEMIANYRGMGVSELVFDTQYQAGFGGGNPVSVTATDELVMVVHAYQRLIDDDGSEGIYCTVFNPYFTGANSKAQAFAKRELMNGYDQYPFAVTRMSADNDRMYDLQAMPERLRGAQWQIKVERDSRIDRSSLATCPPREGPAGRPPPEWGPGRYIPTRRRGEYGYSEIPRFDPGSIEIETTLSKMADKIVGLDVDSPLMPIRQQFYVNKTLEHACAVLKLAYTCFQRFGPDEVFFNVTGVPDPITMENVDDDAFDITMTFDTLSNDPETMKARAEQMASLMAFDKNGRMDASKLVEFLAYTIDPAFASHVLLPAEENQQKLIKAITDDFAKLSGGVAIGPQPNGAQVTLQLGQQWMQQQDVAQRYANEEAFKTRVDNYFQQAQFQIQQAENAQIGRIGAAPADFQGTNLQP
jgi:hypothetical protein